jgi:hypothetical protein
MVKPVDRRLDFERPPEQPVLSAELASLLLALALRRLEGRRSGDDEEAA